ncbi:MAG: tetratricopeptide repeat protein, partial [Nitrospinaceae bacterium]
AFCRLSHLHFKLARGEEESLQETEYAQCIQYADEALARDRQAAVAYFLKGLCLGKLGELRGVWASLGILQPFQENMLKAVELDPAINDGGPHRALGRFYFLLPVFLGGSLDKAIYHLEKAVQLGPEFWENLLYLAEAYIEDHQLEKARSTLTQFFQVAQRLDRDHDWALKKGKTLAEALETQTSPP